MKIIITGAAGFIGTNVFFTLAKEGHEVIGLDSLSRRGTEINFQLLQKEFPKSKILVREIEDIPHTILIERPDIVFHFAAQVAVTSSVTNPTRDFRINAEGTFMIAHAAAEIGAPVIYTSTNKVYGDNVNRVPIKEGEKRYDFDGEFAKKGLPETFSIDTAHHTPYGVSKLVGELYVREFGGIANRCSCMYGPHQFGIVDQGWLSFFAINKLRGQTSIIYGDGKQVRDALYVDDVMNLFKSEMNALVGPQKSQVQGEVFNVGGGYENTVSLLELCEHWDIRPRFSTWRPHDQKVFYCDVSKAQRLLGWQPKVSLKEGLNELFQWTKSSIA